MHPLSCTLLISIWKGLQSEEGFWLRWALGVVLRVASVAVHISVGRRHHKHLPDGVCSFTARTPSS